MQRLLVENLMQAGYHVLFSGETGVGKSVGIQQFLGSAGDGFAVGSPCRSYLKAFKRPLKGL